jgi:four helix bundle protein
MGKFQDLKVWQRSKDLAVYIYKLTDKGAFAKDFSLRDHIRRATVSIPSNIAEGDDLGSNKQAIRHFYISKGSAAETLTQDIIALEKKGCRKYCWPGKRASAVCFQDSRAILFPAGQSKCQGCP